MFIVRIHLVLHKNGLRKNPAAARQCPLRPLYIISMHVLSSSPHDAVSICLVVYLDDLLLAAPSREQLLVNLSTAIWGS